MILEVAFLCHTKTQRRRSSGSERTVARVRPRPSGGDTSTSTVRQRTGSSSSARAAMKPFGLCTTRMCVRLARSRRRTLTWPLGSPMRWIWRRQKLFLPRLVSRKRACSTEIIGGLSADTWFTWMTPTNINTTPRLCARPAGPIGSPLSSVQATSMRSLRRCRTGVMTPSMSGRAGALRSSMI